MLAWYLIYRYHLVNGALALEPLDGVYCSCIGSAINVAYRRNDLTENDSLRVVRAITGKEIQLCKRLDKEHVTAELWPIEEFVTWMREPAREPI